MRLEDGLGGGGGTMEGPVAPPDWVLESIERTDNMASLGDFFFPPSGTDRQT